MPAADGPVLLDNCAVSACAEIGAWNALVARFRLETVTEVAVEAATGFQHRQIIDPREFRTQVTVHNVEQNDRLAAASEYSELAGLDDGERDLWVHALGRQDAWVLCGPDAASIRFGVRAGHAEKLISLEELLEVMGYQPKVKLKVHFTKKWLRERIDQFSLDMKFQSLSKRK
ncbi:MAG: hypothetical protein M3Q08_00010 [Pseudomonadota bacterium]|nr:hypothetical protein [Pseudomonadota bacterium]